jgi:hypothetical protein
LSGDPVKNFNYHKKRFELVLQIGKGAVLFIIGGIVIHTVIMIFDYFLIPEPLYLNLRQNFISSIFSTPMLPMVAAYGASLLLIYSLWMRANRAIQIVQQKELQREKVELVFKAMQQITGIIADHIAVNNAEILGWVEFRKSRGQRVSNRVEKPARNIAGALQSLSEVSFLGPYTASIPKDAAGIEKLLKSRLDIKIN